MIPSYAHSLGGKKTGEIKKKESIDKYNLDPNFCKNCNKKIEIKEGQKASEVRVKKFCNKSCAAIYNNRDKIKTKLTREEKLYNRRNKHIEKWKNITKKEHFDKCKNYFSGRCTITKMAQFSIKSSNREKCCKICGYDKHVEVCHIKGVAEFNDNSTLYDINSLDNLVYLCPNHHWEYDNKKCEVV